MAIPFRIPLLALAAGAIVLAGAAHAAQYGNDTAATGRPIVADGTAYTDQMTPTSTSAWFVFRVERYQSYSVETWSPFGKLFDYNTSVALMGVFESNGTTLVPTVDRTYDHPAPQADVGPTQGGRLTFVNWGAARRLAVRVDKNGAPPTAPFDFVLRIVPTTLAAARWSVNGYNGYFALTDVESALPAINGWILYFDEAGAPVGSDSFSLVANASTQFVHLNGAAIGGAVRGGVRIVHDGAPGAILAHQTLFSPGTNQFIQYPFQPLVHAYGRGAM